MFSFHSGPTDYVVNLAWASWALQGTGGHSGLPWPFQKGKKGKKRGEGEERRGIPSLPFISLWHPGQLSLPRAFLPSLQSAQVWPLLLTQVLNQFFLSRGPCLPALLLITALCSLPPRLLLYSSV